MAEQKHFQYEGNATLKKPDFSDREVVGVEFLVPVRMTLRDKDGHITQHNGQVNWTEQKAYFNNTPEIDGPLSQLMFGYLAGKLTVPVDRYAAPPDVIEHAGEAHGDFEELYRQNVGGCNA